MPYKQTLQRRFVTAIAVLLMTYSAPLLARSVDLHYRAYMAGSEAGEIRIAIDVTGGGYSVQGEAASLGLMETIKALRARFTVQGTLSEGVPSTQTYQYHQRDNSKERLVTVANGEVSYVKNGEQRPNEPVKTGIDLVSALWMTPSCQFLGDVHTGRTQYRFSQIGGSGDQCQFKVVSDDETFDVTISYGIRSGLRVPLRISSTGIFPGEIRLSD